MQQGENIAPKAKIGGDISVEVSRMTDVTENVSDFRPVVQGVVTIFENDHQEIENTIRQVEERIGDGDD